ncbi:hypothetical protein G7Y79_00022g052400 [Physcia stellaris]|nr:hypothetical protein G7Y79_00022g052400 [Physcia stellaris]
MIISRDLLTAESFFKSTTLISFLALFASATASPSTRRAATCTPPSTIPLDILNFSLRVNGHSEGAPELEINWESPQFPTSPGHFVLSTKPMTSPLLTFLNGNRGGNLCDQGDLCSDLGVPSGPGEIQSFSFEGLDQNALPPFEVYGICDADNNPTLALKPRHDSGYESFAVTSFAEGSQVMLRKNGQVGIGSDVTLKIVQH